jgi:hypothetical protein
MRQSGDIDESLMIPNKKSSGDRSGLEVAAPNAALTRAVVLLGVCPVGVRLAFRQVLILSALLFCYFLSAVMQG